MDIPNCSNCGDKLVPKEGKKGIFYVCPNWKSDGSGCEGDMYFPPRVKVKLSKSEKAIRDNLPSNEELLNAMRRLYAKMEEVEKIAINIETKIITKEIQG